MSNLINQQVAFDLFMSRAQELTGITGDLGGACVGAAKLIKKLPSAEPKTGKWIKMPEFRGDDVSGFIDNHFICSECKKEAEINSWGFYILSDFCPNCGADMRKGGDTE